MFITTEDYAVVISENALNAITGGNNTLRHTAEAEAIEEISGYLRSRYDCEAIFSTTGMQRNKQVVMYACDIALYNMIASMPQKMGTEIRKERYDRAIKWLEGVQAGKIVPELPGINSTQADENQSSGSVSFHSEPKLRHNW